MNRKNRQQHIMTEESENQKLAFVAIHPNFQTEPDMLSHQNSKSFVMI